MIMENQLLQAMKMYNALIKVKSLCGHKFSHYQLSTLKKATGSLLLSIIKSALIFLILVVWIFLRVKVVVPLFLLSRVVVNHLTILLLRVLKLLQSYILRNYEISFFV